MIVGLFLGLAEIPAVGFNVGFAYTSCSPTPRLIYIHSVGPLRNDAQNSCFEVEVVIGAVVGGVGGGNIFALLPNCGGSAQAVRN